jgi:hypothetical protein
MLISPALPSMFHGGIMRQPWFLSAAPLTNLVYPTRPACAGRMFSLDCQTRLWTKNEMAHLP